VEKQSTMLKTRSFVDRSRNIKSYKEVTNIRKPHDKADIFIIPQFSTIVEKSRMWRDDFMLINKQSRRKGTHSFIQN
jgi:hypothetical protein